MAALCKNWGQFGKSMGLISYKWHPLDSKQWLSLIAALCKNRASLIKLDPDHHHYTSTNITNREKTRVAQNYLQQSFFENRKKISLLLLCAWDKGPRGSNTIWQKLQSLEMTNHLLLQVLYYTFCKRNGINWHNSWIKRTGWQIWQTEQ